MKSLIQLRAALNDYLGYSKQSKQSQTDLMNTYLNTVNQDTLTQINELKILEDRMQKKKNDFYYMMQEYQRLENVFEENKQNKLKLANQIVEQSKKLTPLISQNEQKIAQLNNLIKDSETSDKAIDEKIELYCERLYNLKQQQKRYLERKERGQKQRKQLINDKNEQLLQVNRQNLLSLAQHTKDEKNLNSQLNHKIKLIKNLLHFLNQKNQIRKNKKHKSITLEKPFHKKGSSDPQQGYPDSIEEQMIIEDFIATLQSQNSFTDFELGLIDSLDNLLQNKSSQKKNQSKVQSDPQRRHNTELQEDGLNQEVIKQLNKEWEIQKRTRTQESFDEKEICLFEFNNGQGNSLRQSKIRERVSQNSESSIKNSIQFHSECRSNISNEMEIMTLKDELSQLNFDESQFWIKEQCNEAQSQICNPRKRFLSTDYKINQKKNKKGYMSEKIANYEFSQEEVSEEMTCQDTSCASIDCFAQSRVRQDKVKVIMGGIVTMTTLASGIYLYQKWKRRQYF